MHETEMGAGSGDAGGALGVAWDYELNHGTLMWELVPTPLRYHYGPANIDSTSGIFTRAELASLAAATGTPAAFGAAMAGTGQAAWWSAVVAAAAGAGVPGRDAPPNALRKMLLHVPVSYPD